MSRNVLIMLRVRNIDTWWLLLKVWRALFLPNFVSRCFYLFIEFVKLLKASDYFLVRLHKRQQTLTS